MTFYDIILEKKSDVYVAHSSKRRGYKVVPDNMEQVWKLLDIYCHKNHKNHLNNNYLVIGQIGNLSLYIDIKTLKEDIRNKNIETLLNEGKRDI